jgi:hypothetical protein
MLTLRSRKFRFLMAATSLVALFATAASASPVMLAGAGSEKVHSTQVYLMQKDGVSVVTVLPDYQGPLSGFAVIVPVPADVTTEMVTTLKREYTDRVALVSAPRFAEFWEMDPCDTEKQEQDWERDLTASADTGFLGTVKTDPSKKVAKEMLLDVESKSKSGEYKETIIGTADEVKAWLSKMKYDLPQGGAESLASYESAGYKFLAMDVDTNRMELVGADRATLSPIRFWTKEKVSKLPTRFGLPSAAKAQELEIFTMVPGQRMQTMNYETKAAPTNLSVVTEYVESEDKKYNLKEKMPEFYTALQDRFLEKNPNTFLLEYAWPTEDCGNPCPTEPLLPHELLSLGADVFEATLPEKVRRPEPPEITEEEKAKLEAALSGEKTKKEKKEIEKQFEADRAELAARKGLIERNKYILSRLHYRYNGAQMPKDVELGPGAAITGGVGLPEGEFGEADVSVKPDKDNHFQTRFNGLFPNIAVVKCEDPKPYRWGKAPRSYRGLRKIWVAEDLARKDRTRVKVDEAVLTAFPTLGLPGRAGMEAEKKAKEEADKVVAVAAKEESGCGCSNAGLPRRGLWAGLLGFFALGLVRRRRVRSV